MYACQKLNSDRTARAVRRAQTKSKRKLLGLRALSRAARLCLAKKQSLERNFHPSGKTIV